MNRTGNCKLGRNGFAQHGRRHTIAATLALLGATASFIAVPVVNAQTPAQAPMPSTSAPSVPRQALQNLVPKSELAQYARKADVDSLRVQLQQLLDQVRQMRRALASPLLPPQQQPGPAPMAPR
jgi:small-conductance mechanosensitive channel